MTRALLLVLAACGGAAPAPAPPDHVARSSRPPPPGDHVLIAIEIIGPPPARRTELTELVARHSAIGALIDFDHVELAANEITAYFLDRGFLNHHVTWVDTPEHGPVTLRCTIEEGPQFKVGDLAVTGITGADQARLLRLVPLHRGDVFDRSELAAWFTAMRAALPDATIEPVTTIDVPTHTISVTAEVAKP